jgi:hypothetical protein
LVLYLILCLIHESNFDVSDKYVIINTENMIVLFQTLMLMIPKRINGIIQTVVEAIQILLQHEFTVS